ELALPPGLVYTYTKGPGPNATDAWYLTAIDFYTGATVWKQLVGTGFGYNNNFAPVTLGREGTAYVGVLGGLTATRAPPGRGGAGARGGGGGAPGAPRPPPLPRAAVWGRVLTLAVRERKRQRER